LQTRLAERQAIAAQIESLIQQLEQTPDNYRNSRLEQQPTATAATGFAVGELGRLQQVFNQLETQQIQ